MKWKMKGSGGDETKKKVWRGGGRVVELTQSWKFYGNMPLVLLLNWVHAQLIDFFEIKIPNQTLFLIFLIINPTP
jgi:hypothetical protein